MAIYIARRICPVQLTVNLLLALRGLMLWVQCRTWNQLLYGGKFAKMWCHTQTRHIVPPAFGCAPALPIPCATVFSNR